MDTTRNIAACLFILLVAGCENTTKHSESAQPKQNGSVLNREGLASRITDKQTKDMQKLEDDLQGHLAKIRHEYDEIRQKLRKAANGEKNLKGDEVVGWLGEVYARILLNGRLEESDSHDYDLVVHDDKADNDFLRIAVKTRKGKNSNWGRTSTIPKIEGKEMPDYLLFVHLNEDYSLDKIWLYPWDYLVKHNRFREHVVYDNPRGYFFYVKPADDKSFLIYQTNKANSSH